METHFILEDEDEENLIDPSGRVLITNGEVSIAEPLVFLDAWLGGLIAGLKEAQSGRKVSVEVEEPYSVSLEPDRGGLWIKYKDAAIFSETFEGFRNALKIGAADFLHHLDAIGDTRGRAWVDEIRAFVEDGLGDREGND